MDTPQKDSDRLSKDSVANGIAQELKDYSHCDSCVKSVIGKFIERADFGMKKYGTNLDRTDLSVLDWLNHAQEEHMDAILYLEKLKSSLQEKTFVFN
jgi:hypothetical protein